MITVDQTELRDVLRSFGLGGGPPGLTPHQGGHINHSWRVTLGGATYLLQRLNPEVFPDGDAVMANLVRVTTHLAQAVREEGLPQPERRVLRLHRTPAGAARVQGADGALWRLFDFLPGTRTLIRVTTTTEAREVGLAFGLFQRLLSTYRGPRLVETIPGFHDTRRRIVALEQAAREDIAGRADQVGAELDFARARTSLAEVFPPLTERGELPERIAHNDAKCSNVLLDAMTGTALAVVDLDTVMPGTGLYDFGDLVRSLTSPTDEDEPDLSRVGVRIPLFEAVARGFLEGVADRLTAVERAHLVTAGELLTYEQGVRFLTDYLNGDAYYRTDRPAQNLERCRTQFRLLETLEVERGQLEAVVAKLGRPR